MPTPHISAADGEFAEAVLLPGDPRRAEYIAETFLTGARRVTAVRNMWGFTGEHDGLPVSVMGTGMGIPSASIYLSELIEVYGARRLIRVGSCGGIGPGVGLREVILATGASTDSMVNRRRYGGMDFAAVADFGLVRAAVEEAEARGTAVRTGVIHSGDLFYLPNADAHTETLVDMGVLAVEMEAAGLYGLAAQHGVRALAVVTVSDLVGRDRSMTPEDRERTFGDMMEIALGALHRDRG
ncbi:MAG: purine-nucleoside phosphorylase [Actinobacteria bacterium]|nr:purine-nucleoside phosphorylase [Actinomycetota bacterium]